jgi:hypothetical protein
MLLIENEKYINEHDVKLGVKKAHIITYRPGSDDCD